MADRLIDRIQPLSVDLAKIINFKESCIDPIALDIINESIEYAIETSARRLESIGKIYPQIEQSAYNTIFPVLKSVWVAVESASRCSTSILPVPPKLPPKSPKEPKVSEKTVIIPSEAQLKKAETKLVKEIKQEVNKRAAQKGAPLTKSETIQAAKEVLEPSGKSMAAIIADEKEVYEENVRIVRPASKPVPPPIIETKVITQEEKYLASITPEEKQGLEMLKALNPEGYQTFLTARMAIPAAQVTQVQAKMKPKSRKPAPVRSSEPIIIQAARKEPGAIDVGMMAVLVSGKEKAEYTFVDPAVQKNPNLVVDKGFKTSTSSLIAKAVMGKKVGDTVEIQLPDGKTEKVTIQSVEQGHVRPLKQEGSMVTHAETESTTQAER